MSNAAAVPVTTPDYIEVRDRVLKNFPIKRLHHETKARFTDLLDAFIAELQKHDKTIESQD